LARVRFTQRPDIFPLSKKICEAKGKGRTCVGVSSSPLVGIRGVGERGSVGGELRALGAEEPCVISGLPPYFPATAVSRI
jgi:hypothetical protein